MDVSSQIYGPKLYSHRNISGGGPQSLSWRGGKERKPCPAGNRSAATMSVSGHCTDAEKTIEISLGLGTALGIQVSIAFFVSKGK
jgi:hypothetical protein